VTKLTRLKSTRVLALTLAVLLGIALNVQNAWAQG
jgi:hypothetical protein